MFGDTAPDSSKCLANLMMKYSCAVVGLEEQSFYSVQSFLGLEDTMLGAVEGDLVAPVAHIKLHEDICPFQLVSDHLWDGEMAPGVLGSRSCIYIHSDSPFCFLI